MRTPYFIQKKADLKRVSSFGIGGPARFFTEANSLNRLKLLLNWANERKIKSYLAGEMTNILFSDKGFDGLIIKNNIKKIAVNGRRVKIGGGNNLLKTIRKLNGCGLSGMERMAGIPGSVGGAVYGCAGAYGQEIRDCLAKVLIYDGKKVRWLEKEDCRFGYRDSVFKKEKDWVILEAEFIFKKADPIKLKQISDELIQLRKEKYPEGLKCAGSYFKNILLLSIKPRSLREKLISKIDNTKIINGKISAGYFLESVGANGISMGDIKVADYHGNLIFNNGKGSSADVIKLAEKLKVKVKKKFGINLEEEVQII